MSEELHIASMIVQVLPPHLEALEAWLGTQPGLEVRATSQEGKLVLVIERPHHREILGVIDDVEQQRGVLSCILVYHEVMNANEVDQELLPVATAT